MSESSENSSELPTILEGLVEYAININDALDDNKITYEEYVFERKKAIDETIKQISMVREGVEFI